MHNKSISVLGCGWLGFPLAKRLVALGFFVKGATTTKDKLLVLEKEEIEPFLIDCDPHPQGDRLEDFLKSDILFLNIPFRRNLTDPSFYQTQIQSVVSFAKKQGVKKFLFTSSTSIYPNDIGDAFEDSDFVPANARAQVLSNIETGLLNDKEISATVLRLSGLYGGARAIGMFLSAKKAVAGANNPVNLIHLDDCVEIITQLIQKEVYGEVFNLVCDEHPLKRDLYTSAAKKQGIALPEFSEDDSSTGKIVRNDKIKSALNYQFIHPKPVI